jgi:hypothetical protein
MAASTRSEPTNRAVGDARRAHIAPLRAAGASIRQISKQLNLPKAAVGRAVAQLNKAKAASAPADVRTTSVEESAIQPRPPSTPTPPPSAPAPAQSSQPATHHVVIDGVTHELRELRFTIKEPAFKAVVKRGLAKEDDPPHTVISALYASLFDAATVATLRRYGWQGAENRAEALIGAVNDLVARLPR